MITDNFSMCVCASFFWGGGGRGGGGVVLIFISNEDLFSVN